MDGNEIPKKAVDPTAAAGGGSDAVDEILRGIMNPDGTFNEQFSDLFSRYLGGSVSSLALEDISDRTGEARPHTRVEYEQTAPRRETPPPRSAAERIDDKLPPRVREIYNRETRSAVRPEFTNEGKVKYPSMGVGASEERVVFDADWEEKAKKEAARREKLRRENMLKGDSTYVRSFRFSSAEEGYRPPNVNSAYIDPLDDSRDVSIFTNRQPEKTPKQAQTEEQDGNSFFPAGFSETKISNAVDGKTLTSPAKDGMKNNSAPVAESEPAPSAADEAVIAAFSGDDQTETAFRSRWEPTVAAAEERREQRAAEAQRMEIVRRAEDTIAQREKETTAREKETMNESKPMNLREFNAQNEFEAIPEPKQLDAQSDAPAQPLIPPAEKIEAFAEPPVLSKREAKKVARRKRRKGNGTLTRGERFRRNNIPCKGDSKKEIVRKLIRMVSFVLLVAALAYLAVYAVKFYERKKQTATFDDQIKYAEKLSEQELADLWANVKATYPDVDFPEGMQVKFSHLYAINSDFVGWLQIDNTNIRTPLLQKSNDNYYYLYHDIYKKSSRYGNPYIHCRCDMGPDGLSRNTIIYGHNTHDGLMFHQLTNYMTRDGYLNAPIVTMDTLYETTKWKIFAVMLTNATPEGDNGYVFDYLYPEFSSDSAFMSKIKEIQRRSMIHTGVEVAPTDKILTLYTCYQNIFKGGRLVILARQLREGESEEINAADVYYDENAHFPQAYYGNYGVQDDADDGNSVVVTAAPDTAAKTTAAKTEAESRTQTAEEPRAQTEAEPAGGGSGEDETAAGD